MHKATEEYCDDLGPRLRSAGNTRMHNCTTPLAAVFVKAKWQSNFLHKNMDAKPKRASIKAEGGIRQRSSDRSLSSSISAGQTCNVLGGFPDTPSGFERLEEGKAPLPRRSPFTSMPDSLNLGRIILLYGSSSV